MPTNDWVATAPTPASAHGNETVSSGRKRFMGDLPGIRYPLYIGAPAGRGREDTMKRSHDQPGRHLITGASRGLGLEFTRQWLARGDRVAALARRPETSEGLRELARRHPETLKVVACDVADDASVEKAKRTVEAAESILDLVVNNAGTFGSREGALEKLNFVDVRRTFEVNTLGPIRISRAFLPLLEKGANPRLVHITSMMGSISDNKSG